MAQFSSASWGKSEIMQMFFLGSVKYLHLIAVLMSAVNKYQGRSDIVYRTVINTLPLVFWFKLDRPCLIPKEITVTIVNAKKDLLSPHIQRKDKVCVQCTTNRFIFGITVRIV
jgi:hypothetical protein